MLGSIIEIWRAAFAAPDCCAATGRTPLPTITKHSIIVAANAGNFHSGRAGAGSGTNFRDAFHASISLGRA